MEFTIVLITPPLKLLTIFFKSLISVFTLDKKSTSLMNSSFPETFFLKILPLSAFSKLSKETFPLTFVKILLSKLTTGSAHLPSPRRKRFYCPAFGTGTNPEEPLLFSLAPIIVPIKSYTSPFTQAYFS
jgi:hypothetical protein